MVTNATHRAIVFERRSFWAHCTIEKFSSNLTFIARGWNGARASRYGNSGSETRGKDSCSGEERKIRELEHRYKDVFIRQGLGKKKTAPELRTTSTSVPFALSFRLKAKRKRLRDWKNYSQPVNIMVLPLDFPHNSIKCTTSPKRKDGCPANTTHGVLKQLFNPSETT